MREIKFRAWNKVEKFMDTAWSIDWEHESVCHRAHNQSDLNDCVLMQYTGLKDKNGKEIYEGDIIRIFNDELDEEDSWVDEVGYHMGGFFSGDEDLLGNVHFRAKVIGNIYENPELLETAK